MEKQKGIHKVGYNQKMVCARRCEIEWNLVYEKY